MKTKICPECGSEMVEDYGPKITSLANEFSEMIPQVKQWRCKKCGHTERYDDD